MNARMMYEVSSDVAAVWVVCGLVLWFSKLFRVKSPRIVRWVFHEVKPFYLPVYAIWIISGSFIHISMMDHAIDAACGLMNWFNFRNIDDDDDDRWKRRQQRASQTIKRIGSRLTLVPAENT